MNPPTWSGRPWVKIPTLRRLTQAERSQLSKEWLDNWIWFQNWAHWGDPLIRARG